MEVGRDGWGHYLAADGALKRQVTSGEFVSDDIVSVDDKTRTMIMTAAGREVGEDPYYTHAYRVALDTGVMKLLDPGDASHAVTASDSGRFFVDTSSRVNTPSVLLDATGTPLAELETPASRPRSRPVQVPRAVQGEGRRRHH